MTAPIPGTRHVVFLAFDGVTMLDVTGPVEVLAQARRLGLPYEITLASPDGGEIRTSSGLGLGGSVPVSRLVDTAPAGTPHAAVDTVVIAGGDRLAEAPIEPALTEAARLLDGSGARRVASVCTGAFLLAELGVLDGRRAATHWRHAAALARRRPAVRVEPDALYVRDGRYLTSAGISAGLDLALALVEEDHGPAAAREIARELVVFMQRPGGQSQFSTALDTPPTRHAAVRALTDAVVADPGADHSLPSMAASAAVSTRHLTRLFRTELGTTPARWVERVRVDLACRLLLEGHAVTAVARRAGLGSDETLRRAFARHLGTTPSDYRARFTTTTA
ncbi:GlxA family transcriptional regulator (plasmid) [Streptomyces sp. BI20]|uniref:GlxA family transcriptional regulator n=1 Tax=Streptomyces sp. BI20 TaxID=3403460 RepID=UPI003C7691F5